MGKRKLSFKIIDLIYWGIILCSAVWEFVSSTNGSQFGIDSLAEGMTAAENMMMVLFYLCLVLTLSLGKMLVTIVSQNVWKILLLFEILNLTEILLDNAV